MLKNITIGILLLLCGYLLFLHLNRNDIPLHTPANFILPDGGKYYGNVVNGKLEGEGEIIWENGSRQVGVFKDGLLNGEGEYWGADNSHYIGHYSQGLSDGKGIFKYHDGTTYEGEFKNNVLHGEGVLTTSYGDVYTGEFEGNDFHGEGVYVGRNGTYKGNFESGEIVSGQHNSNFGVIYNGEFKDWTYHGKGRYKMADGSIYIGTFKEGQLQGEAKYKAADGTLYKGNFENFTYSGYGELTRANGNVYKGLFEYGDYHGEGTLILAKEVDGIKELTGDWQHGRLKNDPRYKKQYSSQDVEAALYNQNALLDEANSALALGELGVSELYFLGVAGFGKQDVFLKEINILAELFNDEKLAKGRSLTLINNYKTLHEKPLATSESLARSVKAIEEKMNLEEDILFLYLTSHGSKSHKLSIQLSGMDLPDLSTEQLTEIVNKSKIKWKVIFISACYSGGFIPSLENENHLVITAARKDRTSFGCNDRYDMTFFAKAYFKNALPKCKDFITSFYDAKEVVKAWEDKDFPDLEHSLPQMYVGSAIKEKLTRWHNNDKVLCFERFDFWETMQDVYEDLLSLQHEQE